MLSPLAWIKSVNRCACREVAEWSGNIGEVFFCAIVPVFWMLVVWGLLGDGVITKVPVGFVDEDKSRMSREVYRALDANRALGLVPFENMREAMGRMRAGNLYAVIAVPFSYARDMRAGLGASVSMYVDENRFAVAGTLQAEFNSVMTSLAGERVFVKILGMGDGTSGAARVMNVIHSDYVALGNMQFSFLAFLGGALMPGVIMLGAMLGFVTAILREEWQGSAGDWLESANYCPSAAITGKLLPHYGFYCLVFLFYMSIFCGFGGFVPAGSLFVWFACGACCLGVFAAMSVLVAGIAPNWRFALIIASGYAAPALPFTGFSIPLESMSVYARSFSKSLPLTWLIQGQAQQWTLGAELARTGETFGAFAILFLVPAIPGLVILGRKLRRIAQKSGTEA